jgi:hypothetical protein
VAAPDFRRSHSHHSRVVKYTPRFASNVLAKGVCRTFDSRQKSALDAVRQVGKIFWASARWVMNFSNARDETLIAFYESVRRQVRADIQSSGRRFVGETAKKYAEHLREEMDRRRLLFKPIDWPESK